MQKLKSSLSTLLHITVTLLLLVLSTGVLTPEALTAQETVRLGDPMESYLRILSPDLHRDEVSGFMIRPSGRFGRFADSGEENNGTIVHPWENHPFFNSQKKYGFRFYSSQMDITSNSHFVSGQNDGALWQGRGLNSRLTLGAGWHHKYVDIVVRPEFLYSENIDFDLAPNPPFFPFPYDLNEYAEGLARIDTPQRFGDESFTSFHPGQSWIRLKGFGAAAGVSTANIWSGPALYNPLLLSNNAPGFFHAFLETDGPLHTPAGNFELQWFWGGLRESDWFDDDPTNNLRYTTGLIFSYNPRFAKGLHLGFSRLFYENYPDEGLSTQHLFRVFQSHSKERFSTRAEIDVVNQSTPRGITADTAERFFTLFGRWVFPDDSAEVWFEWGRNDSSHDYRNLFTEGVHTRSYVIGLMKRFTLSNANWLVVDAEITQLENKEQPRGYNYPVWYESALIPQGFTHFGQVIGAGIGPGSNSQKTRIQYIHRLGKLTFSLNRIVHQNDRYFRHQDHIARNQEPILRSHWGHNNPRPPNEWDLHNIEYRFSAGALLFVTDQLEFQFQTTKSFFQNRHNIYENDEQNINVNITMRYTPAGFFR